MINFTMATPKVWVKLNHNGNQDVVDHVQLLIKGEKQTQLFEASLGLDLDLSTISNFVPYDQLTTEKIIGWCEAQHADEIAETKLNIENIINEQLAPSREMRLFS